VAPLGEVIRSYGVDLQLYLPVIAGNRSDVLRLESCVAAVQRWLSDNFLLLNSAKTEMIVVGPAKSSQLFDDLALSLPGCVIYGSERVKNLGVVFDRTLSFTLHIREVTRVAFYHLRNIARLRQSLTQKDAEILIHAFVSSRLDYCNVLFSGLPRKTLHTLQLVQNAAARILTGSRKFDHITPVLAALHWLPVEARADYKVLLLTYKAVNGAAPSYLCDLVKPYAPVRALRSQGTGLLCVPRVGKRTVGERAFAYRAPTLWNALPPEIRQAGSADVFKARLKTHLFKLAYGSG